MKRTFLLGSMLLTMAGFSAKAQLPRYVFGMWKEDLIDPRQLKLPPVSNPAAVEGVYRFGESEAEWTLVVIRVDDHFTLQKFAGHWGQNHQGKDDWIIEVTTYDSIRLVNGKFTGKGIEGFLVTYSSPEHKTEYGVAVCVTDNKGKIVRDSAQYGSQSGSDFKGVYEGEYPELSYQVKSEGWFAGKDQETLQIMRNEIFARYGMRFVKGGKMDTYFSKRRWYRPRKNDVMHLLNEIERRNIARIQAWEKKN